MFILNFPTGLGIACRRAATTTIGCLCLAIALLLVACDDGPADTEGPQETSAVSAEVTAAATLVATPEGTPSADGRSRLRSLKPLRSTRLASTPSPTPTAQPSPMPSRESDSCTRCRANGYGDADPNSRPRQALHCPLLSPQSIPFKS